MASGSEKLGTVIKKAMNEIIDSFDKVTCDYMELSESAMKYTYKKVTEDLVEHSRWIMHKYYEEYDPKVYDRTGQLMETIIPIDDGQSMSIQDVGKNKKHTVVSRLIGTGYYVDPITDFYHSKSKKHSGSASWKEGGDVEGEWVLNTYISGHRPSGMVGDAVGIKTSINPVKEMDRFINNYCKNKMPDKWFLTYFASRALK